MTQRAVAAGGESEGAGAENSPLLPPLPPPVFIYDFVARDPGTFWWHSHVRSQAIDGLRGTLVVRGGGGGEGETEDFSFSPSPFDSGGGVGDARDQNRKSRKLRRRRQPEATLFVSDWYGVPVKTALNAYLSDRNANGREPTPDALTLNGESWWWRDERGGGNASSSQSPSSSLAPPPPSVQVFDPQGDSRGLASCSEPRYRHTLVRVVNGGSFATVAVSFRAAEAGEEARTAAEAKPKPLPLLRATVVSADAVPCIPKVIEPYRPLRLGVGQRHDVELCALETEEDDDDSDDKGGSNGGGGGEEKEKKNKTHRVPFAWAVAVADGALFDAPMRISNVTAMVLLFGDGGGGGGSESGRKNLRLTPPMGINLSDAGAAAAPALSLSSTLSSSPPPPSPEPTVWHSLTISFNKQQQQRKGFVTKGGGKGGEKERGGEEEEGPSYSVEGVSQRPRGLDDPRKPSLLEMEREMEMMAMMRSPSSVSGGGNSGKEEREEEEGKERAEGDEQKEWNALRHPLGAVVEMLVSNDDDVEHSWHLHGHNFWIVDGGEGRGGGEGKTPTTTKITITEARDTALIPAKSEIRARYVADSPGVFLAHCHMSWHEAAGLAVVMVDGFGAKGVQ